MPKVTPRKPIKGHGKEQVSKEGAVLELNDSDKKKEIEVESEGKIIEIEAKSEEKVSLYPSKELEECSASPQVKEWFLRNYFDSKKVIKFLTNYQLLFICIIVLILSVIIYIFASKDSEMTKQSFPQVIDNLFLQFGGQPNMSKRILISALKPVVNLTSEPSSPAVITVLASPGATTLAKEFCVHLSESLVHHDYTIIDENIFGEGDDDQIKLKIDEEIKSRVDENRLNAVIVHQFEKIPLAASMIFHNYCDDTYPRFKRVIYLFILTLDKDLEPDADSKKLDSAAMRQYNQNWNRAHFDETSSLITRLTMNVINIRSK